MTIIINTVRVDHILKSPYSWIIDSDSTKHIYSDRTQFRSFRNVNKRIKTATSEIAYTTGREDVKLILQHKNGDVALLLTNILYTPIKSNLLNITRLAKKNIEIHFKNISKLSLIVISNEVVGYTDIKEDLYYLRITNSPTLSLDPKNLYSPLAIDQDEDSDSETNTKCYSILNLYTRKESGD